jgi:hypothetical protein
MASGRGPLVVGSASFNKAQQQRSQQVQDHDKLCSSLTQLSLYVYPTGSFRISKDQMCLSPEAFKDLEAVEDKPTAMQFRSKPINNPQQIHQQVHQPSARATVRSLTFQRLSID